MKVTILSSIAALVGMTTVAHADPASIGSLVLAGLLSAGPIGTAVLSFIPAVSAATIGKFVLSRRNR